MSSLRKVTAPEFNAAFDKGAAMDPELRERIFNTLTYYDNMSGDKFRAPNLANATDSFLVDELGEIKAEIKPRQTYEKLLSSKLKLPIENGTITIQSGHEIKGEKYTAKFNWVSKMIMDGDAVKRYCDNPQAFVDALGRQPEMADFMKPSEYWEIRLKEN